MNAMSEYSRRSQAPLDLDPVMQSVLTCLLKAHDYALNLRSDVWDLAVEIDTLHALGLTDTDLRWLACKGYVEHAKEITRIGEDRRSFRSTGKLFFTGRTCVVLTPLGLALAQRCCSPPTPFAPAAEAEALPNHPPNGTPNPPVFDTARRELRVGNRLIKRFKQPALSQETILAAFEEEGWPYRILNPLPPKPNQDSKQRLHDAIIRLNRGQKHRLLRFKGDGTGEGIFWEYTAFADPTATPERHPSDS
jgi:hypothetical protein